MVKKSRQDVFKDGLKYGTAYHKVPEKYMKGRNYQKMIDEGGDPRAKLIEIDKTKYA